MVDLYSPGAEFDPIVLANQRLGLEIARPSTALTDLSIARQLAVLACLEVADGEIITRTAEHMKVLNNLDAYEHSNGAKLELHQDGAFERLHDFIASPPISESGDIIRAGRIVMPTRTGKTAIYSKLVDAIAGESTDASDKVKTLILVPRRLLIEQTLGDEGLEKFAPDLDATRYYGAHKDMSGDVVVMTYQSFVTPDGQARVADADFGVVILDEAHRALGKKTAKAVGDYIEDKIAIGLTATDEFSADKKVENILPHEIATMRLREAVDTGLTAPVRSLLHTTEAEIPSIDPNRPDFTERELSRLAHVKARNDAIVEYARGFVEDGRQGIVGCLPGYNLAHAKHIVEELSKHEVVDPNGVKRNLRAAWVGGEQSDGVRDEVLKAFERGEIDVLAHVQLLTEGFTTKAGSFYINGCPTTSPVKLEQSIGRVIGKRLDGREAIVVDFLDKTVGKEQQTVLSLLGEDTFELTKIIGDSSAATSEHEAETYLRGILHPELLEKLVAISGKPLKDILIGANGAEKQPDEAEMLRLAWETRLENEGMPAELGVDTMGLPLAYHKAFAAAYEVAREAYEPRARGYYGYSPQGPSLDDIYEFIERDRRKLGLSASDSTTKSIVKNSNGLQVMGGLPTTDFRDGLGYEEAISTQDVDEEAELNITPQIIKEILCSVLDEREVEILQLRFGLSGENPKTLDQVGSMFSVQRERIRQIEARAMSQLRHPFSQQSNLRGFLQSTDHTPEEKQPRATQKDIEIARGRKLLAYNQGHVSKIDELARALSGYYSEYTDGLTRTMGQIDIMLETVGLGTNDDTKIEAIDYLFTHNYVYAEGLKLRSEVKNEALNRGVKEFDPVTGEYRFSRKVMEDLLARAIKKYIRRKLYGVRKELQG